MYHLDENGAVWLSEGPHDRDAVLRHRVREARLRLARERAERPAEARNQSDVGVGMGKDPLLLRRLLRGLRKIFDLGS